MDMIAMMVLDDEDVGALVVTADVVHLADRCRQVTTMSMALQWSSTYSQSRTFMPSPYTGRILVLQGVVDHQRDELLRELVRAVVVGAAGDIHRQAVGIVERLHEKVRRRLGCAE